MLHSCTFKEVREWQLLRELAIHNYLVTGVFWPVLPLQGGTSDRVFPGQERRVTGRESTYMFS